MICIGKTECTSRKGLLTEDKVLPMYFHVQMVKSHLERYEKNNELIEKTKANGFQLNETKCK